MPRMGSRSSLSMTSSRAAGIRRSSRPSPRWRFWSVRCAPRPAAPLTFTASSPAGRISHFSRPTFTSRKRPRACALCMVLEHLMPWSSRPVLLHRSLISLRTTINGARDSRQSKSEFRLRCSVITLDEIARTPRKEAILLDGQRDCCRGSFFAGSNPKRHHRLPVLIQRDLGMVEWLWTHCLERSLERRRPGLQCAVRMVLN